MADHGQKRATVTAVVHRLVEEAADRRGTEVHQVSFDPTQRAMSRPPHWPADTCLGPGDYCTPRYMVVDYLGRGGIGQVFEVRDMRDETYPALKAVPIESARPEILEKVAAEARSLRRVEHSNLLRVYDAGICPERKLLYFVMERLDGLTLQQRIGRAKGPREAPRRPAIGVLEALRLTIGIARALNALHEAKIIHRDIKPENVFCTGDGGVKVFDLNIAKFNDSCGVRATERGITMGTVLYMSPEHLHEGRADERSDIYAVGFVLFEMVAGHHAFATGLEDVPKHTDAIAWHAARMPPRLSDKVPGVPIVFDAIIRKCVEKDPAARYQNCLELIHALSSLERIVAEADAAAAQLAARTFAPGRKKAVREPDVVVRAAGTAPSPKLPEMTTERTATAVPSVPLDVLPDPIFRTPRAAVRAGGDHGAAAAPALAAATRPASAAAPVAGVAPSPSSVAPPVAPSGVRPVEPPATQRAEGPGGTELIVPLAARPTAGGEGAPAVPRRAPGGTEIIALSIRAPAAPAAGDGVVPGAAGGGARGAPENERTGTGTADLPVVVAAPSDARAGSDRATAELPVLPDAGAEAARGAVLSSRRSVSNRRDSGLVWRVLPFLACVVVTGALTSLVWLWLGRRVASTEAEVGAAAAIASAAATPSAAALPSDAAPSPSPSPGSAVDAPAGAPPVGAAGAASASSPVPFAPPPARAPSRRAAPPPAVSPPSVAASAEPAPKPRPRLPSNPRPKTF